MMLRMPLSKISKNWGNELLTDWGESKESQKFAEASEHHPDSSSKKNTFTG